MKTYTMKEKRNLRSIALKDILTFVSSLSNRLNELKNLHKSIESLKTYVLSLGLSVKDFKNLTPVDIVNSWDFQNVTTSETGKVNTIALKRKNKFSEPDNKGNRTLLYYWFEPVTGWSFNMVLRSMLNRSNKDFKVRYFELNTKYIDINKVPTILTEQATTEQATTESK